MQHALTGAQLLAAWSIQFTFDWPRLIVSMVVLAGLMYASYWAYDGGDKKKKK